MFIHIYDMECGQKMMAKEDGTGRHKLHKYLLKLVDLKLAKFLIFKYV